MQAQKSNELKPAKGPSEDQQIDWAGLVNGLKERLWLVGLTTALACAATYYYLQVTPLVYSAKCTVALSLRDRVLSKIEVGRSAEERDSTMIATIIETMKSSTILENLSTRLFGSDPAKAPPPRLVSIVNRQGTSLIDITAEGKDAKLTADLANGVVSEYLRFNIDSASQATSTANGFLLEEANRIATKLANAELQLQKYREDKKATSLEKDQDVVVSRFRELSNQLNIARDQRLRIESDMTKAEEIGTNPNDLMKLQSLSDNPQVAAARSELSAVEGQMAVLKQRYLEKHPRYKAMDTQLKLAQTRYADAFVAAAKSLSDDYRESKAKEERLRSEVEAQEGKTYELGRLQIEYDKLKREIDADKAIYDQVLGRLKETDMAKGMAGQAAPLLMIEPAAADKVMSKPNKFTIWKIGPVGGLLIGFLISALLYYVDTSIKTVKDAEDLLRVPVLSAISIRKKIPDDWATAPKLDTIHNKQGPISEAFRTLRSEFILLGRAEHRRVVLVTSALPGEGKSFTAANLSVTFAQQGNRTLLIDLDLRRPTVGKTFFDEVPKIGVSDVLTGSVECSEAIEGCSVPNLFILSAGSRAPNPSELLGNDDLRKLVEKLRSEFDQIVIDSPPVIAVSDPLLIAPLVDSTLMVIKSRKTSRSVVQRACEALEKAGGKPICGSVLNQLPRNSQGGYYYYSAGYYGSKGVYGAPA